MGTSAIGEMNIILSANAASFSAGIDQAQRQLDKLAGKAQGLGRTMTSAGHTSVSSLQATSGALRLVEGGMTNSLRAAERFVSMIPGIGGALKAAFPVVGAVAVGAIFLRAGEELAKFIKQVQEAPEKLNLALGAFNNSERQSGDELELANDKLRQQIALIEGKPVNNAALALDEARLASDRLADSLEKSASRLQQILQTNGISTLQSVVSGILGHPEKSTTDTANELKRRENEDTQIGYQISIAQSTNDTATVERLKAQLKRNQDEELSFDHARTVQDRAQAAAPHSVLGFNVNPNATKGIDTASDQGVLLADQARIASLRNQQKQNQDNAQLESQLKSVQAAKEYAGKQKEAAAELVQQWRQEANDLKSVQDTTLAQEAEFWVQRAELAQKYTPGLAGKLSSASAMNEANKLIAEMRAQNMKAQQESSALTGGPVQAGDTQALAEARIHASQYLSNSGNQVNTEALKEQGNQAAEYIRNLNEQISLQRQNATAIAEAALQMQVANGQMSRLDAAQVQAALHTQEYNNALAEMARAYQAIESQREAGALTPIEVAGRTSQLDAQSAQIESQRTIQVLQDSQAVNNQTVAGASHQALDQMVSDWQNMSEEIAGTLTRTVGGFNDDIAKLMTGQFQRGQIGTMFGKTFLQAGEGLAKASVEKTESAVLGGFGFGKRDGSTPQAALYVQMAGAPAPVGSSTGIAGSVLSEVPGAGTADAITRNLGLSGGGSSSISGSVASFVSRVFGGGRSGGQAVPMLQIGPEATDNTPEGSEVADVVSPIAKFLSSAAMPTIPAYVPPSVQGPGAVAAAGSSRSASMIPADVAAASAPLLNYLSAPSSAPSLLAPSTSPASYLGAANAADSNGPIASAPDVQAKPNITVTRPQTSLLDTILGDATQVAGKIGGQMLIQGAFARGGNVRSSIPALVGEKGPELFVPHTAGRIVPNSSLFQGHFDVGGDILANRPAMVGEQGPEMFMPASAGRIIPNDEIGGRSGDTHTWTIDARGTNDPAQVTAQLDRYMRTKAPQIAAATMQATKEQQLRRPMSAR